MRSRAANARSLGSPLLAAAYRADVRGSDHLPAAGPVVIAAGHPGAIGRIVLATWLPRPAHVAGAPLPLGGLPSGRIAAYRLGTRILGESGVVAVAGDPALAAALALRARALVVPVAMAGTSGRNEADPPRLRSTVTVAVLPGVEVRTSEAADPLAWPEVRDAAERVRQVLADAERELGLRMGRRQR